MLATRYAIQRLKAVLDEIDRLKELEFPYADSHDAVLQLEAVFQQKVRTLEQYGPELDPGTVNQECARTLGALFKYTPVLGFILRSTNVRNAFEAYKPLRRLARTLLDPGTPPKDQRIRLLLSSEWNYSPMTMSESAEMPGYVLIGIPAPESGNPLLIPLAGHELGHTLWNVRVHEDHVGPKIEDAVLAAIGDRFAEFKSVFPGDPIIQDPSDIQNNVFAYQWLTRTTAWAKGQALETYCDLLGLRLFGASFVYALIYFFAPKGTGARSQVYPSPHTRVKNLLRACEAWGISVNSDHHGLITDVPLPSFNRADTFLLSIADSARQEVLTYLIHLTHQDVDKAGIDLPTNDEVARILGRFRQLVPAEKTTGLPAILNAGWEAYLDPDLWRDHPALSSDKQRVLSDLLLKNMEVFEIEEIVRAEQ